MNREIIKTVEKIMSSGYFPVLLLDPEKLHDMKDDFESLERLFQDEVDKLFENKIIVKSRTGQPNFSPPATPWVGFHLDSDNFDSRARYGIYVSLIFKADGSGVALSLIHGVDRIGIRKTKKKTEDLRNLFEYHPKFKKQKLNLKSDLPRPRKYEIANLFGKEYVGNQLDNLAIDLPELIDIYVELPKKKEEIYQLTESDDRLVDLTPPQKKPRSTTRNNNNNVPNASKTQKSEALGIANNHCEVSDEHQSFKKNSGASYVEAHHLIPMEFYYDERFETNVDYYKNIYALCPNCHRMIHYANYETKKKVLRTLYEKRQPSLRKHYGLTMEMLFKLYEIGK
jgi:5-methylcytosine-specific restriction protein A|tara:strand:+ start:108 stop:1127 length:1020 start_codon:yes stop_codon:yes gene_type:complete